MSSTLNFKTIQVRFHFLSFLNNPVTFSVYLRIIHSMKKKSPHIIILFLAFLLALGYGTGYLGQKLQEEGSFGFFQKKKLPPHGTCRCAINLRHGVTRYPWFQPMLPYSSGFLFLMKSAFLFFGHLFPIWTFNPQNG